MAACPAAIAAIRTGIAITLLAAMAHGAYPHRLRPDLARPLSKAMYVKLCLDRYRVDLVLSAYNRVCRFFMEQIMALCC